ncbi:MAG: class I SAM-dependent methyltransferase [Anaerolineae bacterium]
MKFNPLKYPIMFSVPRRLSISSWTQHIPFAMLIVDMLRPRLLVELGTHYGVSYCSFCQAVEELHLETLCYAIDTWQGDEHTGPYSDAVYEDLKADHDPRYGAFSRLLRTTFDNALPYFADKSIDLLHIDGYHTYEAVKHDFEAWLPKLSDQAVVLLHDITEREREFGVWRLWDELKTQYPSFEILHEHGLGVLAVGTKIPDEFREFVEMPQTERAQVREILFILGSRITAMMQTVEFADRYQHVIELQSLVSARDEELANAKEYIASLVETLEKTNEQAVPEPLSEFSETAEVSQLKRQLETLREQLAEVQASREGLSTSSASQSHAERDRVLYEGALNDSLETLSRQLAEARANHQEASLYAETLAQARAEKEKELRDLQTLYAAQHYELNTLKSSFIYRRIGRPVWTLRQRAFPDGRRRTRLYYRLRRRPIASTATAPEPVSSAASVITPSVSFAPAHTPIVTVPAPQVKPPPLKIQEGDTVICTIISKNYIASARTLMQSIRAFHPDIQLVTLLVDEIDGQFDPRSEVFSVFLAADLDIPNWSHFSMKYDIMELNTAVKPYLLHMLMEKFGARRVIYFDPDIAVYHDLNALFDLLDSHMAVLTPHILDPIQDTKKPAETDFLQVGAYNLGFFAISKQGQWHDLLHWWEERLYDQCTREIDRGLFVDQHWMDLLPSLFDSVYVLRDPGYNVAYWNIQGRDLSRDPEGHYLVNGHPLVFFHFSGFSVDNPNIVSKHQNRFVLDQLNGHYQACFEEYRLRLLANEYAATRRWDYAYGHFSDGVPVPDVLRICLREHDLSGELWKNPYDPSANGFRSWAVHPRAIESLKYVSPYALTYYRLRRDLQKVFPNVPGADEQRYAEWFVAQAGSSDVFHTFYVEPIRAALNNQLELLAPLPTQKKTQFNTRFKRAVEYYRTYPSQVKPYLPPEVYTTPSADYTGPNNFYGSVRWTLHRIGVLRGVRRVIGPRVVMTARHFFSQGAVFSAPVSSPAVLTAPLPRTPSNNEQQAATPKLLTDGANIIGYLRAETGVAEAARRTLSSLSTVQFPVCAYSIDVHDTSRKQDTMIDGFPHGLQHRVNVFHINADMTEATRQILGTDVYQGRYNIGYWFWEMSQFPDRWRTCANTYDEIWVATRFVEQSIQSSVQKPVIHMPGSIDVKLPEGVTRAHLGIPDDQFIVLFVFDALSIMERKNPWAIISAFERAFTPAERASNVRLVIKVTNLERFPAERARLMGDLRRVNGLLLDGYMSRLEVNALIHSCDVYISLHRSEGFGLTLAEAMYMGKPCIATAYSGNMDFMTEANSYLVPYQLTELTNAYPPYDAGNHWAEPNIEAAAQHLRAAYTSPDEAREKGVLAQRNIRDHYSPNAAGTRIAARLNMILKGMK